MSKDIIAKNKSKTNKIATMSLIEKVQKYGRLK